MNTVSSVPALLLRRAAEFPTEVAFRSPGGASITFAALADRSERVAAALGRLLVGTDPLVAMAFANDRFFDHAVAYFGVQLAGGIPFLLGEAAPERERRSIAAAYGIAGFVDGRPAGMARWARTPWEASIDDLVAGGRPLEPAPTAPLAVVLHTSGTTGEPKAVGVPHGNLLSATTGDDNQYSNVVDVSAHGIERSVHLHTSPIGTNALHSALLEPLRRPGHVVVVLDLFTPAGFVASVERHRPASVKVTPAMAVSLLRAWEPAWTEVLACVRQVSVIGDRTPVWVQERLPRVFRAAELWNGYSSTEAHPAGLRAPMRADRPDVVGRSGPYGRMRVCDGDRELGPNEVGDIWLSETVPRPSRLYLGDPVATASVFVDGWTRTGDAGFVDRQGDLHLVGRRGTTVVIGGRNVSLVAVERALEAVPGVTEAAAAAVAHPTAGQRLVAGIVAASASDLPDVRAELARSIEPHAIPMVIERFDHLPRNASGKLDRDALAARIGDRRPPAHAGDADDAESALRRQVQALSREVLDVPEAVTIEDLFDAGLDSLGALGLADRLSAELAVTIEVEDILDARTVTAVAKLVSDRRGS